eukprot:767640-Hanusia_phi.AAC.1
MGHIPLHPAGLGGVEATLCRVGVSNIRPDVILETGEYTKKRKRSSKISRRRGGSDRDLKRVHNEREEQTGEEKLAGWIQASNEQQRIRLTEKGSMRNCEMNVIEELALNFA